MSDTKDTKQDAIAKVDTPATASQMQSQHPGRSRLVAQDPQGLKTIIDVASSRGAFKPK